MNAQHVVRNAQNAGNSDTFNGYAGVGNRSNTHTVMPQPAERKKIIWVLQRIHVIKQTTNAMKTNRRDRDELYTTTLLVNDRPIKLIKNSGSPVFFIPQHRYNNPTPIQPLKQEYKDVNDKRIKFVRKTQENIKTEDRNEFKLKLLITKNKTNPLLGLDRMDILGIYLNTKKQTEIQLVQEDEDTNELKE